MNIAAIFAGGSGTRMNTKDKPKQFLLVHGKPIIVHTLEKFENHPEIDGIVLSCIKPWIPYMEEMKYRYRLNKLTRIVPGGDTGQMSIYNSLCAAEDQYGTKDVIVLIHDGVRPLIDDDLISRNIQTVKLYGNAITATPVKETILLVNDGTHVETIPNRKESWAAKAPQSFYLKDILSLQRKAIADGNTNMIDTCTMLQTYGVKATVVEGSSENIKITTPDDFYTFRALYDAKENEQLE